MNKVLPILLLLLVFAACNRNREEINPYTRALGTLQVYRNFPLKPFAADTLRKTLWFDFNENAQRSDALTNIKLQLVERTISRNEVTFERDTVFSIPQGVILLKNGEMQENNILVITPQDTRAEIGITFTNEIERRNHTYTFMLRVIDGGGLHRIGNINVSEVSNVYLPFEWEVMKVRIWNPLGKVLFWVLVVVAALLLIWRILIRPRMFESFKVRALTIIYPNGMERVPKKAYLKTYKKVVCSNKKQNQSFVNQFFTGKIYFVQNEFWEQDIEIAPRDKKSVQLRSLRGFTASPSSTVAVDTDVEVTNNNTNKIVKLKIN